MEAKNMAPGIEQGVSRITEALPRRDKSVLPKPALPHVEKPKQSWLKSKVVRGALSVLALTGLVGAAHEVLRPPEVKPSFDNSADSQIIRMGINTMSTDSIDIDELRSIMKNNIKPAIKGEYPDVSVILPLVMAANEDIKISTLRKNIMNWMTGKSEDNIVTGKKLVVAKKGTEIVVPLENAEIFQFHAKFQMPWSGIVIKFNGPDQTPYEIVITAQDSNISFTEMSKNAPLAGNDYGYIPGLVLSKNMKGLPLSIGTDILETIIDNANITFELETPASKISKNSNAPSNYMVTSNFSLITQKDANSNNKVLILPSSK